MVVGVDQIHAESLAFCVWGNAVVGCVDSMLNIEDMPQVVTSCFYIDHSLFDTLLVALVLVLLLWYSRRIISITRHYSSLREGDDQDTPKRRLFKR